MDDFPALQLFGAGREKRIYGVPPYTKVKSLDFDDHPFAVQQWEEDCALCGAEETFLDEVILDDKGGKMYVCSDSHYCARRRAEGHRGYLSEGAAEAYAAAVGADAGGANRSEEHTSELQSLMRISYAVFCLKKKKNT